MECIYLSLFYGRDISSIYYIRCNYMFRRMTMAIFRLYMKYLTSSYTRLIVGCIWWGGRRYSCLFHVQTEDGHYQAPKHVAVPYVVNTRYISTIK
jgi:hypothetical protein